MKTEDSPNSSTNFSHFESVFVFRDSCYAISEDKSSKTVLDLKFLE